MFGVPFASPILYAILDKKYTTKFFLCALLIHVLPSFPAGSIAKVIGCVQSDLIPILGIFSRDTLALAAVAARNKKERVLFPTERIAVFLATTAISALSAIVRNSWCPSHGSNPGPLEC
jgi:hypothetical protein